MSNSNVGDLAGPDSMPSGLMMGVSTATMAGMAITVMPPGGMTGVGSMAIGEMPGGPMMGVPTATMAGMAITVMPIGDMTSAERYGAKKKGELPTMKIPGEWHITLSPASLRSGTRT